jgi:hypothetical protein
MPTGPHREIETVEADFGKFFAHLGNRPGLKTFGESTEFLRAPACVGGSGDLLKQIGRGTSGDYGLASLS